jgi:sugar phosphate isomerase/epimerase
MKLGYSSATAGIYDLNEAFRLADELGLDFVELNCDTCDFLPQTQLPEKVRALVEHTGIGVSVHLPFIDVNIASLMPLVRKASVEQTLRGLDFAEAIHASCAVLHTGKHFAYQPIPLQASLEALHSSLQALEGAKVPIALENLALYTDGLIREPEMLNSLTQAHRMKNCLDFGHALIESTQPWRSDALRGENLIQKYIEVLDRDIVHLHLCNNNGIDDLHDPTTQGVIQYEHYANYLSQFAGSICLEVAGGQDSVRQSVEHIRSLYSVLI